MNLNLSLFERNINNIKNSKIRAYLLEYFRLKKLIFRLFVVLFLTLVCSIFYWVLRTESIDGNLPNYLNYGIGFNPLHQTTLSIIDTYIIKFILPLLFFIFFIFINNKLLMFFSYLLFINSLFLGIDKFLLVETIYIYSRNSIVDYININNIFYCNIGDIFIFISILGIILICLFNFIKILKNKNSFINSNKMTFINRKIWN